MKHTEENIESLLIELDNRIQKTEDRHTKKILCHEYEQIFNHYEEIYHEKATEKKY